MSTDDISRYEFSKRIYSYQTRFNYPSPFTQTTKITHANNIVKHDGYSINFFGVVKLIRNNSCCAHNFVQKHFGSNYCTLIKFYQQVVQ